MGSTKRFVWRLSSSSRRQRAAVTALVILTAAVLSAVAVNAQASDSEFDTTRVIFEQPPVVRIPPTYTAPQIDGAVSPAEWDHAASVTGFFQYDTGEVLDHGPVAMMATTLQLAPWKAWLQFADNVDVTTVWPHPNSEIMMSLNDPDQVNATLMAEQVQHAHEKGVPMLSVASCPQKFTLMDRSARQHQLEWQVLPESKLNREGVPNIQNCANSYSLRK